MNRTLPEVSAVPTPGYSARPRIAVVGSRRPGLILMALAFACPSADAAVFTVGSEAACTHASIQQALDALPAAGSHEIRLRAGAAYTQLALQVQGRQVALTGGYADCSAAQATGASSILDGQGGAQAPVLRISGTGNAISLNNLIIRRGDAPASGHGGGIIFNGGGVLALKQVIVANNYAGAGGGINVSAVGGAATLYVNAGTVILNNTAQFDGGGIRLWGDKDFRAELFMHAPDTAVMGNQALGINPANGQPQRGFGGGIMLNRNAHAEIGSPGLGTTGALFDNQARHGGGLALVWDDGDPVFENPYARLFTTDAARPVRLHGNRALLSGGAIFQEVKLDVMCLFDVRIDDNRAVDGSAIHVRYDSRGSLNGYAHLFINQTSDHCDFPSELGAVACAPDVPCNSIDSNVAATGDGQPTTGATVLIGEDALLHGTRVRLRDNLAGQVLLAERDRHRSHNIILRHSLIADNTVHGRLIETRNGADLELVDTTMGGNAINGQQVLAVDGDLAIHRSILYQPGTLSLAPGGGARTVEQVLTSERQSLDGGNGLTVAVGDPRFLDPEHGDYRLHAASDAADFAPAVGSGADLDGRPYNIDLPVKPNRSGPRDLGAYERQALLPLVRNGDFPVDLRRWDVVAPGTASWLEQGVDAGAVLISQIAPTGGLVLGLRQCIPLPGPGVYALNAHALAPGTGINRDIPALFWRYRANSATCTGASTTEGELVLPRSGSFASAPIPARFASGAEWTRNATLEVTLAVRDGDLVGTNAVRAQFDRVVLAPAHDDAFFADGFEAQQ
jgi:hypothetical protein